MSSRQEKERRRQERVRVQAEAAAAEQRRKTMRFAGGVVAALAVLAIVAIVAVNSKSPSAASAGPTLTPVEQRAAVAATADVPQVRDPAARKALADLRAQGSRVISDDVAARVAKLAGVPVVVNQWASWCPNCRAEFGYFQSLSRAYDGKVAFLGLDSNDSKGDAESFLKQFPVSYPSIDDPGATQARSIGAGLGWPTTVFYDAKGKQQFIRQGGYTTQESLDADIRAYALG